MLPAVRYVPQCADGCTIIGLEGRYKARATVDDLTVLSPIKEAVQQALDIIFDFMADTGQKVNLKKTKAIGTNEDEFVYEAQSGGVRRQGKGSWSSAALQRG